MCVTQSRQIGIVGSADCQSLDAVCAKNGCKIYDFFRAAGVTQQQYDILRADRAKVAMDRISWMQDVGRYANAGERCGNLRANEP